MTYTWREWNWSERNNVTLRNVMTSSWCVLPAAALPLRCCYSQIHPLWPNQRSSFGNNTLIILTREKQSSAVRRWVQLCVQTLNTASHVFYGGSRFASSVPVTTEQEFAPCSGLLVCSNFGTGGSSSGTEHLGTGRMWTLYMGRF